jgi:hypothetical protein
VKPAWLTLFAMAAATPAAAQQIQFSGILQGDLGYGTNPFVRGGVTQGSGFASGSFKPSLVYQTARSTTTLDGSYSRDEYFRLFGHRDSALASLKRVDLLTEQLVSTLSASFTSTNSATIADPAAIDNEPLNIGRRTYHSSGQYQLQWQASAKDQLVAGGEIDHTSYGSRTTSSIPNLSTSPYTQYAVNGGYNHSVDARTTLGAQVTVSAVRSKFFPDSRTVQPSLTAKRQLNAIWEIDGHVGVVLQHISGQFAKSTTSISYGLNLCGDYPHTKLCISGQHQTAPSGYGALRTNTSASVNLSHDLTEHSRATVSASYYKSSADKSLVGQIGVADNARAFLANGQYDRDLTQRLSAGFGATYQWRDSIISGSGHAVSASVHLRAKLGRL